MKIKIGSLVKVHSLNKMGVVMSRIANKWLVIFPTEESKLCTAKELEVNG